MRKNIISDGYVLQFKSAHILAPLLIFVLILSGCNKEPQHIPGQSVQGINAPIAKILFSPLAFDGAQVKVQGHITGLIVEGDIEDTEKPKGAPEIKESDPGELTTLFKLVDTKGNYLNIILPGTWDIEDGDYLIVGGIFRKDGNEIEAHEFEIADFDEEGRVEEIERRDDW